jgi:NACalpha-BTF3-like transcription factor
MIPGMGGANPRQLAMMMKKLGIDVEEIDGVEEVVVRTRSHEYRFSKAQVSIMRAQGSETWQIVGKPAKTERAGVGGSTTGAGKAATGGSTSGASGKGAGKGPEDATGERPIIETGAAPPPAITDEDVRLVMKETGKDATTARKTLESCGGDLAEAILRLS